MVEVGQTHRRRDQVREKVWQERDDRQLTVRAVRAVRSGEHEREQREKSSGRHRAYLASGRESITTWEDELGGGVVLSIPG
jgi:hypothetical protein